MANPGLHRVANYETAQPAKLFYEETPYCWIVETVSETATDTGSHYITAGAVTAICTTTAQATAKITWKRRSSLCGPTYCLKTATLGS